MERKKKREKKLLDKNQTPELPQERQLQCPLINYVRGSNCLFTLRAQSCVKVQVAVLGSRP